MMTPAESSDLRYPNAAYRFLLDALESTRRRLGRDGHVTGQELLRGIEDLGRELYGPTAAMVFQSWGIREGHDFGFMVFELVDRGVLARRQEDQIEDFSGNPPYEKLFEEDYFLPSQKAQQEKDGRKE